MFVLKVEIQQVRYKQFTITVMKWERIIHGTIDSYVSLRK